MHACCLSEWVIECISETLPPIFKSRQASLGFSPLRQRNFALCMLMLCQSLGKWAKYDTTFNCLAHLSWENTCPLKQISA